MIRFSCPHCQAPLKAKDDRAGLPINCPKCARAAPVPKALSPDEELPTAELDAPRRRIPRWVWAALATLSLALLAIVVVVATRPRPKDGLTRSERAQLEANLRTSLPGVWEAVPVKPNDYSYYTGYYHFTDDGKFRAYKAEASAPVTKWVGTWAVSGSTLTMKITEFVHAEAGDRVSEQTVLDVRSEDAKVFRFTTAWADTGSRHLTFTRQNEPPPKASPPPPAKKEENLTADQRMAKWLFGAWESLQDDGVWEWDFHAPAGTRGLYTVKVMSAGRQVGVFRGQWLVAGGRLTLAVQVSQYARMPVNSSDTFDVLAPNPDGFVLRTPLGEDYAVLTRKK